MDLGVAECVKAFLRRYPRYCVPATAASRCRIATGQLVDELAERSHAARLVWVRRPRTPFVDPHPRALEAPDHALAQLASGEFIDVTRRQYDPGAAAATSYLSEGDLANDWEQINDTEDRDIPWRTITRC